MNENTALTLTPQGMPAMEVARAVERYTLLNSFIGQVLREGTDYGKIPGTGDAKTLLKPGAEKLAMFFGLSPTFEHVRVIEDWTGQDHGGEPFFYYLIKCRLTRNGSTVAEAEGSCNSWESKFRYRQGERVCPACGKATIIKGREEYGGGWLCFAKKGGCGAKFSATDKTITEQQTGRVLNPDPADQVNTILKQAEKRALVAVVLIAVNASDYFTQDIEDLPGFGEIVETHVRIVEPEKRPPAPTAPEPEPPAEGEFRQLASATDERAAQSKVINRQPEPSKTVVTDDKPTPKLAVNRAPAMYANMATGFAAEFPAYKTQYGVFDDGHIRARILLLGFGEITPENINTVFDKLAEYALSQEADAAAGQ
jgi:hypothetical protein